MHTLGSAAGGGGNDDAYDKRHSEYCFDGDGEVGALGDECAGVPGRSYDGRKHWAVHEAENGQCIAVQVTGNFIPNVPSFSLLRNSVPMTSKALVDCEAN